MGVVILIHMIVALFHLEVIRTPSISPTFLVFVNDVEVYVTCKSTPLLSSDYCIILAPP